jgi:hypothetical protein
LANQDHTTNVFRTVVTDNGVPPLSTTNSFTVIVNGDPMLTLVSATLVAEGCLPSNNAIDPGEPVTLMISLRDVGLADTTNLVATLLETNGLVSSSGSQAYGALLGGGAPVSQPFTFAATGACGGSLTILLQLQDGGLNLGTVSASFTLGPAVSVFAENFDSVTAPALPAGWTTSATGVQPNWRTTNSLAHTLPNAAFSADAANIGINELVSPAFALPMGPAQLSFSNYYNLEAGVGTNGFDGGVLEIKIGTNAFVDVLAAGGTFVSGGYNTTIDGRYSNPLAGRQAWSGANSSFIPTVVNLPPGAAGQSVQLRWRCGTDNGVGLGGWRIDTIAINARVCCADSAPGLPAQPDRTIPEMSLMVVTNTAIAPGKTLSYTLRNPPSGMQISTNGIISWTPTEAQGSGTNLIITVVSDDSLPPLGATNSFTVIVSEVNSAPVLPAQDDVTIGELTLLVVTNTGSDLDLPANTLAYSLRNPPAGAVIDSQGVITWIPGEDQGPGSYTFETIVTDDGIPAMSVTNSFTVTVNEVNTAPILPVQGDQTIAEMMTLTVTNAGMDLDLPLNQLTYAFLEAPAGASINSAGVITWTPNEAQGPSTNIFVTVVTDNGTPPLSATNSFKVIVTEVNSAPVLPMQVDRTLANLTALTITNTAFDSDLPLNHLTYLLVNPPTGALIDETGVISWTAAGEAGLTNGVFVTVVTDDGVPALSATNIFTISLPEPISAPVILQISVADEIATITWTTTSGRAYQLQYKDDLSETNWNDLPPENTATGSTLSRSDVVGGVAQRFYRIRVLP